MGIWILKFETTPTVVLNFLANIYSSYKLFFEVKNTVSLYQLEKFTPLNFPNSWQRELLNRTIWTRCLYTLLSWFFNTIIFLLPLFPQFAGSSSYIPYLRISFPQHSVEFSLVFSYKFLLRSFYPVSRIHTTSTCWIQNYLHLDLSLEPHLIHIDFITLHLS